MFDNSSILILLGQNLSATSLGARDPEGDPPASSVTLEPQTINGTVASISNTNGFSVYTVTLASYDLIPTMEMAGETGGKPTLTNATTVAVYADSNTQLLTSGIIGQGSLARFRGVIFNDNGVARMDCQEILDGVPE